MKEEDGTLLQSYADTLWQCCSAMETIGYLRCLAHPEENYALASKLPNGSLRKWNRTVTERIQAADAPCNAPQPDVDPYPSFQEFCSFVDREAKIACSPLLQSVLGKLNQDKPETPRKTQHFMNTNTSAPRHSVTPQQRLKRDNAKRPSLPVNTNVPKSLTEGPTPNGCTYCQVTSHFIDTCHTFLKLTLDEKRSFAKNNNLCFTCLRTDHSFRACRALYRRQNKAPFLPIPKDDKVTGPSPAESDTISHKTSVTEASAIFNNPIKQLQSHNTSTSDKSTHFAMVVPVAVAHRDTPANAVHCYAMVDTQSDSCFISESLLETLRAPSVPADINLITMGTKTLVRSATVNDLCVTSISLQDKVHRLPTCYARSEIPCNRDSIPSPDEVRHWNHLRGVADQLLPRDGDIEVGLLLGYNFNEASYPHEVVVSQNPREPYAIRSPLGWLVTGPKVEEYATTRTDVLCFKTSVQTVTLEQIKKGFVIDFIPDTSPEKVSYEDRCFDRIMRERGRIDEDGHVELPLPVKPEARFIPGAESRDQAYRRFLGLRCKFLKDVKYEAKYVARMKELFEEDQAEEAPPLSMVDTEFWYLSHHSVPKGDDLRVVFDGSMEVLGVSLNSLLLKGPDLCNSLAGILLRFRIDVIVLMCDIRGMFLQVRVTLDGRNFLRFFWFRNNDPKGEIIECRVKVHLFGATSSPSCAMYALRMVANRYEHKYGSEVAEFLRKQFYVDDGLIASPSVDHAISLYHGSRGICSEGGFTLAKFASNSKEVMQVIPLELRSKETREWKQGEVLPMQHTLGVALDLEKDAFVFHTIPVSPCKSRRELLSTVSSIYDPLGLIAPVLLKGRQILQQLCKLKWDELLPTDMVELVDQWLENLQNLRALFIPRSYKRGLNGELRVELHIFVDASNDGHGSCAYLVLEDVLDSLRVPTLVMSKVRVAPLKPVTMPRRELQAAVVGVKLKEFLEQHLPYDNMEIYMYSDSQIVLAYIMNPALRLQLYAANRVEFIRDRSMPEQWRYVNTTDNPADIASRGCQASDIVDSALWWEGPQFLSKRPPPNPRVEYKVPINDPELKREPVTLATTTRQFDILEYMRKFSSWDQLLRAIMTWKRCARVLYMKRLGVSLDCSVPYSVIERENAIHLAVSLVQRQVFEREYYQLTDLTTPGTVTGSRARKQLKSDYNLQKLDVYLDEKMVMRVGGRIRRSNLPIDLRHPMILPSYHFLTELVVEHLHVKCRHAGHYLTMNLIRSEGWWILRLRSVVSKWIYKCVTCRKLRRKPEGQKMADLPIDRLEETAPFTYCGVDFCGPFNIRFKRSTLKRWICLFTCLAIRAVHVEVCYNLSTDSFLQAYRRFVDRRGPVRSLRCDRGTNLMGARTCLESALQGIDSDKVQQRLLKDGCDWTLCVPNPPKASHMGGVWERMIQSFRRVLEAILLLNGTHLDDESLLTFATEAEAILNGRPLTYIDVKDPDSMLPLSPNTLLTLKHKGVKPPVGKFTELDLLGRKRWDRVQFLADVFWSQWREEYIPILQERRKWLKGKPNLSPGDVVLLVDDAAPRCDWPMARILEVKRSADGLVRQAKIKTQDGVYERPIHKIILLFRSEGSDD